MGNKRVFTKMDVQWGYNNVRINEGDEWKATFTTHVGLYEPVVMFFWNDKFTRHVPRHDE